MSHDGLSDSDLAAIREASANYERHAIANDWDAWIELIGDDAVYLPPGEPAVSGRAAVRSWVDTFPHVDQLSLTIADIVGQGDLAVVRGSFSMSVTDDAGVSADDEGKYVEVWARQADGSWKMIRDIWNSSQPLAG